MDKVKTLILMGATANKIEAAVKAAPNYCEQEIVILHANSMEKAVALAKEQAQKGDIVSLSPASASFDLYPNFEDVYKRQIYRSAGRKCNLCI